jgi:hypothetical protein
LEFYPEVAEATGDYDEAAEFMEGSSGSCIYIIWLE